MRVKTAPSASDLAAVQPRLAALEVLLVWEGGLTNARIRELFGVSQVHASRLLAALRDTHGSTLEQSSHLAPLRPGPGFVPSCGLSVPDDYLKIVSGSSDLVADWLVDARIDLSPASSDVFSKVAAACRSGGGLKIEYGSLTTEGWQAREVFPHMLIRAPRRWHFRAWCNHANDWRDFALGRVRAAEPLATKSPHPSSEDVDWATFVNLEIGPHPALTAWQQEVIAREYLHNGGSLHFRVRRALSRYVLADWAVATDINTQHPPDYQLALRRES